MPYSRTRELPKGVRNALPPTARRIWMRAFNDAWERWHDDSRAAAYAWGAVKQAYEKGKDGRWHRKKRKRTTRRSHRWWPTRQTTT